VLSIILMAILRLLPDHQKGVAETAATDNTTYLNNSTHRFLAFRRASIFVFIVGVAPSNMDASSRLRDYPFNIKSKAAP
jgi:hypothetical protein